jgi:hypothetical protein
MEEALFLNISTSFIIGTQRMCRYWLFGGRASGKRKAEKGLLDRTRFSGGLDRLSSQKTFVAEMNGLINTR